MPQRGEPGSQEGPADERDDGLSREQDDEEEPADAVLPEDEQGREGQRATRMVARRMSSASDRSCQRVRRWYRPRYQSAATQVMPKRVATTRMSSPSLRQICIHSPSPNRAIEASRNTSAALTPSTTIRPSRSGVMYRRIRANRLFSLARREIAFVGRDQSAASLRAGTPRNTRACRWSVNLSVLTDQ